MHKRVPVIGNKSLSRNASVPLEQNSFGLPSRTVNVYLWEIFCNISLISQKRSAAALDECLSCTRPCLHSSKASKQRSVPERKICKTKLQLNH